VLTELKQNLPMLTMISKIREDLFKLQDLAYRDFHSRLVPVLDKNSIIGVRTPALKKYAKEVSGHLDIGLFLRDLPHTYYEENNLHAFIIASISDFDQCIEELNIFLPYVDNWATCDGLRPKCFALNKNKLLPIALGWINDERTYIRRFGIQIIMNFYLDESFDESFHQIISSIRSDEYYVKMMVAWYFATALAKQYDKTVVVLENRLLDKWTHNKTIQKAIESYRISDEIKDYLRTLRLK